MIDVAPECVAAGTVVSPRAQLRVCSASTEGPLRSTSRNALIGGA